MKRAPWAVWLTLYLAAQAGWGAEFFVAPDGRDTQAGTTGQPFATLVRAQQAARTKAGQEPVTVWLRAGTYYLPETLVFTAEDSGREAAPVVYQASPGAVVVLSGGARLTPRWERWTNGIWKASVTASALDQLFINGERQPMARYPNFDATVRPYGGFAADAFSPARAARWADPAGGFIHAMHSAHWGGYHYRITDKNTKGEVTYEGGWQNNRQMGMHREHRFVENIFEELDAPGEWFHHAPSSTLYYYPLPGVDLATAVVETARLRHLVEFRGTPAQPVRFVSLRGVVFRHAARTFMDVKEPLLRSDWTIYRGGAARFAGAEDCALEDCEFDQVGGNGVFVTGYNRRVAVRGTHFHGIGASAVAFVGDTNSVRNPLFEYQQRQSYAAISKTPGPQSADYPADCLVEDCLIRQVGVVEKQATGVEISMALGITLRHCSIYEASRAGINISEGTFGGHVIEFCDVFDTVRETGDHGSFNSWGRDRYWGLTGVPPGGLPRLALLDVVRPIVLRNNRWRCDHGWDVDLDDGSSNYEIYNNLFLHGGLKLREGFQRRVWNNIVVNNSLHPHVWYENSGDIVTNNIFMGAYRPAAMSGSLKQWGQQVDGNLFTTTEADRTRFAAKGCDAHSLVGDPLFVDPAKGDFRVRDGSPALKLGFQNFPMDRFGVRKPALRAIARTPEIPALNIPDTKPAAASAKPDGVHYWLAARIKNLEGEEFSAFGVSRESGGVHLVEVPGESLAARSGLRQNDLIQEVNGQPVRRLSDLFQRVNQAAGQPLALRGVRGQQPQTWRVTQYPYAIIENAAAASEFKQVTLGDGQSIRQISARPGTQNEPVAVLRDGRAAANYGPVFANGVLHGAYRADLGSVQRLIGISTWSHNQNDRRGAQRFTLYGSAADHDPGWAVADRTRFTPIAEVDTTGAASLKFHATRLQAADRQPLGAFRWLVWVVEPVTDQQENTAYQEFQAQCLP